MTTHDLIWQVLAEGTREGLIQQLNGMRPSAPRDAYIARLAAGRKKLMWAGRFRLP